MKRITKLLRGKLRSRRGDSIAEVLIALLISSVALVMLASMISTSVRMITASRKALEDYYAKSNELSVLAATDDTSAVTVSEQLLDGEGTEIAVYACENDSLRGDAPVAYRLKPSD